ncbi:olfactory receptor 6F1-like [Sphaerodactylus townsendi]|uniref:olfactory receptor 6F1-like n=1 Tax=Sphaerodactylus townsendi TaxID=933632 RepID=UPI0020269A0A|nr:olfactory receptor 6F1-like [Sphaerodactylus townsendi]
MEELNERAQNKTTAMEFTFLGFPESHYVQTGIFLSFLFMYILTVLGNVTIVILVITNSQLHTPMYFLLWNLSFLEIWYTTAIMPKTLSVFLGDSTSISFNGCIVQMYFNYSFGCTEFFLLSAMAYDRYLAICYPLQYSTLMNLKLCCTLAAVSWLLGFLAMSTPTVLISKLSFCGPNVINHFYCHIDSWISLSCSDTHAVETAMFIVASTVILSSCLITFLSYAYIIYTILHIASAKGRRKAFSTCSSHFAVVVIWFGSTMFLYIKPSKRASVEMTKFVNVLNTIVTPLLNPFIYTLRNKDVKAALKHSLHWGQRKVLCD